MVSLYLATRDDDDNCFGYDCDDSSTWTWARWILFVLFLVGLALIIFSACRINKKRVSEGRGPIRGTAWMTPPSYYQSQQNTQNPPFVPQYTATTNDNDMGYYDAHGNFVPNPKLREAYQMGPGPGYNGMAYVPMNSPMGMGNPPMGPVIPDQTGATIQSHGPNPNINPNQTFAPPPGPPPSMAQSPLGPPPPALADTHTGSANSGAHVDNPASSGQQTGDSLYQRPEGPPPSHLKN